MTTSYARTVSAARRPCMDCGGPSIRNRCSHCADAWLMENGTQRERLVLTAVNACLPDLVIIDNMAIWTGRRGCS